MSGRVIADRYQLQTMLGRGGMAVVWQGVDVRLGRPVAVKLLNPAGVADPEMLERFDREARTAAGLTHPNIVAVHDVGSHGGEPYLVMELVDGRNLAAVLADGPLDIGQVLRITNQVCAALVAAHAAGVVHRDIKPANILLTPAGAVKVCDFGIARLLQGNQATLTATATAIGTSYYMAPEQAAGKPVDGRTDLYALGCLLYAMLTGNPPFTADNPLTVMWQHLNEPALAVGAVRPGIPADLDRLVGQLLAKNPAERPGSAGEVRDRLARLSGQPGVTLVGTAAQTAVAGTPASTALARPTQPVRAAAAVASQTRMMPALDDADESPVTAGRFRVGPARIAAVATVAVILAVLTIGLLLTTNSESDVSSSSNAIPDTASVTPTVADRPAGSPVDRVRAVIAAQLQAGQLNAKTASDLNDSLDEIARQVAEGRPDKVTQSLADVRDNLADLRGEEKITTEGYDAVLASFNELAGSIPTTKASTAGDKGDGKRKGKHNG